MAQRIRDAQVETKAQLEAVSSLTMLTNLADLWAGIQGDVRAWADTLRALATDVGAVLDQLVVLSDTWTRTREEAVRSKAPPAVLKRIDDSLGAIAAIRNQATARRVALLTLQVKVGELLVVVEEASAQVAKATAADMSTLLQPDSPPVWRAWPEGALADLPARVRESAAPQLEVFARFAANRYRGTVLHMLLLVGLAIFAITARRQVRLWEAAGSVDPMLRVFEMPIATALIVSLLLTDWASSRPPMIAINLMGLIVLVPIVRILTKLTAPGPTAAIWVAVVFFVLNRAPRYRPAERAHRRAVRGADDLGGSGAVHRVALATTGARRRGVQGAGARRLARARAPRRLVPVRRGGMHAAGAAVERRRAAQRVHGARALRRHARRAGDLGVSVARLAARAPAHGRPAPLPVRAPGEDPCLLGRHRGLGSSVLRWFSLSEPAANLGLAVLEYRVTRGFVSLSLGDVLAFVATVWLAFLVSRFVRFALEEDVFPRLPMGRGLPYAISSLLHYVILLLGFLAAVGAMGVDLNRATLLTGAFGVGIGFGLQTIVNNFVSGIILLLERPIQVGDAIQMTDLDGEVRRIGIRSTTVHTWRGAEVIVPNATLISGNLTNWTLSDRTRRFELPVGVAYGADPQRVIDLLRDAAASVTGVLKNPAPIVLFQSFGDSALNFEVRAWTARFEEWAAVHSQVAVAVNAALKAAGIEIPFPQRDVTLRFPPREET